MDGQWLPPRFARYIARCRDGATGQGLRHYPGLQASPWHNAAALPLVRDLEAHAAEIAAEFEAVDRSHFHVETERIERSGAWEVLFLFERGKENEHVTALCPITTSILKSHRVVKGLAGLAYFSRMAAGTSIAPHQGPTNMRLRCHLGIVVPPGCELIVDGVGGAWHEGRCLVFDDSFVHEARNTSGRDRIVLIVDIWHPDLTDDEVSLLEGLHRYIDASANGLSEYWRKNSAARGDGN